MLGAGFWVLGRRGFTAESAEITEGGEWIPAFAGMTDGGEDSPRRA